MTIKNQDLQASHKKIIDEFFAYQVGSGLSKATCMSYQSDAICFLKFCYVQNLLGECVSVDKSLITRFIAWLLRMEIKKSTIQRRVMGILAFWAFLFEEGHIKNSPMTLRQMRIKIRPNPNPTHPLKTHEFKKFTEGLSNELAAIQ